MGAEVSRLSLCPKTSQRLLTSSPTMVCIRTGEGGTLASGRNSSCPRAPACPAVGRIEVAGVSRAGNLQARLGASQTQPDRESAPFQA